MTRPITTLWKMTIISGHIKKKSVKSIIILKVRIGRGHLERITIIIAFFISPKQYHA